MARTSSLVAVCLLVGFSLRVEAQQPSIEVSGLVRDARTGAPVAGATVSTRDARSPVRCGATGRFEVRLSPHVDAVVTAPGYVPAPLSVRARDDASTTQTVVIRLVPVPRQRVTLRALRLPVPLDDE